MYTGKTILITGGAGYFGKIFIQYILQNYPDIKKIVVFSRDELKHFFIKEYESWGKNEKLSFVLGDITDKRALEKAFEGVDYVIHAAALKHLIMGEDHPNAFIKTNIYGTENVIQLAQRAKVKKVILLSTDKAVEPVSLYGSTKLCAEKLFTNEANKPTIFSVVRFGNILGASGSVLPHFIKAKAKGMIPLTHPDMTRFLVTPVQSAKFVDYALHHMEGGEIFIPKVPSFKIIDLIKAVAPNTIVKEIGLRRGEKLHENLISSAEMCLISEEENYYIVGRLRSKKNITFISNQNQQWYDSDSLKKVIELIKL